MVEENLLAAWLKLSLSIRGNRVLKTLSFNEVTVINALTLAEKNNKILTFKELVNQTKMLKSQLNRVLGEMVKKNYISVIPSETDKRSVCYKLVEENKHIYREEHENIMRIFSEIKDKLGEEKTMELAKLLLEATNVANEFIEKNF